MAHMQAIRVLCLSWDLHLLESRRLVLRTRYVVFAVRSVEEMLSLPQSCELDVILLCHTLPEKECKRAVEAGRGRWPGAKLLVLSTSFSGCAFGYDGEVRIEEGPVRLLSAIEQMVMTV